MQFDYEAHSAKLELRIMELEDTTKAMVNVLKTMNEMLSSLGDMVNQWALMTMPSVFSKLLPTETPTTPTSPADLMSRGGNGGATAYWNGAQCCSHPPKTTSNPT